MLFNSINFAIFMPLVFLIYWALGYYYNRKSAIERTPMLQNLFLLAASYLFYAWWDWRFLSLILICSFANYGAGLLLMKNENARTRKTILTLCCIVCLGILGVFKYYDFFATQLMNILPLSFANSMNIRLLHLILPIGISFYTFHTLSYAIDVYRRKFEPTKDIISFFLFVSIFPLAMAGPIERASNLLPQIYKKRVFNYDQVVDGMRQILWGLFKKVVIADNCATFVNPVFDTYQTQDGSTLLLGLVFFAFQIYGDFSGYSDMALGIGKLLGFKFLNNFRFPYFSRDIAEFWRRWHISLNSWFRDYLYIPLGGSRGSKWMIARNTFVIFLVSGFWHGANWTFIAWGAFHAILFLPLILRGKNKKNTDTVAEGRFFPNFRELIQMFVTFGLATISRVFFRSETIGDAIHYFNGMMHWNTLRASYRFFLGNWSIYAYVPYFIIGMIIVEWVHRNKQHGLELTYIKSHSLKFAIYYVIIAALFMFGGKAETFIYFQF